MDITGLSKGIALDSLKANSGFWNPTSLNILLSLNYQQDNLMSDVVKAFEGKIWKKMGEHKTLI